MCVGGVEAGVGGAGPCLNCSFAPGIEMLEIYGWRGVLGNPGEGRPRTPRTLSAVSSFITLTTPSV